jgi:hypothetical protein
MGCVQFRDQKSRCHRGICCAAVLWSVLIFLTGIQSRAEYRAYELRIEDTEKSKSRTVLTVLDHLQYPQYYPLNKGETIAYVDSWMCFENMSFFRKICAKPDRRASSTVGP